MSFTVIIKKTSGVEVMEHVTDLDAMFDQLPDDEAPGVTVRVE